MSWVREPWTTSTWPAGGTSRSPSCGDSRAGSTLLGASRSPASHRCAAPSSAASWSPSGCHPRERTCSVCAVDLANEKVVAILRFDTALQEIFTVTVLPGRRWSELINNSEKLLENSLVVPNAALANVPAALRAADGPTPHAARRRSRVFRATSGVSN